MAADSGLGVITSRSGQSTQGSQWKRASDATGCWGLRVRQRKTERKEPCVGRGESQKVWEPQDGRPWDELGREGRRRLREDRCDKKPCLMEAGVGLTGGGTPSSLASAGLPEEQRSIGPSSVGRD